MRSDFILIRVIATILVILGHAWMYDGLMGFRIGEVIGLDESPPILIYLNKIIYTFHMPIFFSLSGALLAVSINKYGIDKIKFYTFIKKKLFRILLPFIIITIFYCIPIRYMIGYYNSETPLYTIIKENLIKPVHTHMWFLPTLFWTITLFMASLKFQYKYKISTLLIILLFLIIHLIGIPGRFTSTLSVFCFDKAINNIIFVILGFMIERYNILRFIKNKYITLLIIGWIIIEYIHFITPEITCSGFYAYLQTRIHIVIMDIIGIIAIVLFFKIVRLFNSQRIQQNQWIMQLNKHSFEIYLYSEPINYIIIYLIILLGQCPIDGYSLYFIRAILSLIIALGMAHIIKINFGQK